MSKLPSRNSNSEIPFQNTINEWSIIFMIAAALYILPALVFILLGSGNVQKWNDKSSRNEQTTADAAHPWAMDKNISTKTPIYI